VDTIDIIDTIENQRK